MTYTIGTDCHITLAHNDIDSSEPYGFLCPLDNSIREAGVQMVREVSTPDPADPDQSTDGASLWCYFDVLMSDTAKNPDGTPHAHTRAEDYAKLLEFLDKAEGITLTTPVGAILNLGSLGFSADERHHPKRSLVKCQLNNVGYYYPPVDPALLALALWGSADTEESGELVSGVPSLAWDTGYWV